MDHTSPDLAVTQTVRQSLRTLCFFGHPDVDECRSSWAVDSLVLGGRVCRSCSRSEVDVGAEVTTSKESREVVSSRETLPSKVRWPTTSLVTMIRWSAQSLLLMAGGQGFFISQYLVLMFPSMGFGE